MKLFDNEFRFTVTTGIVAKNNNLKAQFNYKWWLNFKLILTGHATITYFYFQKILAIYFQVNYNAWLILKISSLQIIPHLSSDVQVELLDSTQIS